MEHGVVKMKLVPALDIQQSGREFEWQVTGDDSQFLLRRRFGRSLQAGVYQIVAVGAENINELSGAALYWDSGKGLNETNKAYLKFTNADGMWVCHVRFTTPIVGLRFDPTEGAARPKFSLKALDFHRITDGVQSRTHPKVLLNLVRLLPGDKGAGGAGRVALALLRSLPEYVKLRVAVAPYNSHLAAEYPSAEFVIVPADDNAHLSELLRWCECYVDPMNALRPTSIGVDVPTISVLHDLQHLRYPHFFLPSERKARSAEYGYAAARSNRLVTVSSSERTNFEYFYGLKNVSVVHWCGFMAESAGLTEEQVRGARSSAAANVAPYLIYAGVPWAHKNHEILIQAIAILRNRGTEVPTVLTNAAGGSGLTERLPKIISLMEVENLIDRKGFLPERELLELYLNATGMVFPSLYEGFGIPLADAMQLGVPIIVSDLSTTREVCGDACQYLSNPRNALTVADDLEAFWRDPERRRNLSESGYVRSQAFSLKKVGRDFAQAINQAVKDHEEQKHLSAYPSACQAEPFASLAVFVIYKGLSDEDIAKLLSIEDINVFHTNIFGSGSHVTVGLDISYAQNSQLRNVFRKAERLICFNSQKPGALEFATQDFSLRFDDGEYQLVTTFPLCERQYGHSKVWALILALNMFSDANFAVVDQDISDSIMHARPSERDGIIEFEHRRRTGCILFDTMIRRDTVEDAPHGSISFLSQFCLNAKGLSVPEMGRL